MNRATSLDLPSSFFVQNQPGRSSPKAGTCAPCLTRPSVVGVRGRFGLKYHNMSGILLSLDKLIKCMNISFSHQMQSCEQIVTS